MYIVQSPKIHFPPSNCQWPTALIAPTEKGHAIFDIIIYQAIWPINKSVYLILSGKSTRMRPIL